MSCPAISSAQLSCSQQAPVGVAAIELSDQNDEDVLDKHACFVCLELFVFQPVRHTGCHQVLCALCVAKLDAPKPCPNCRGMQSYQTCVGEFAAVAAAILIVCQHCREHIQYAKFGEHIVAKHSDPNVKMGVISPPPRLGKKLIRFAHIVGAPELTSYDDVTISSMRLLVHGGSILNMERNLHVRSLHLGFDRDETTFVAGIPFKLHKVRLPFGISQAAVYGSLTVALKVDQQRTWNAIFDKIINLLIDGAESYFWPNLVERIVTLRQSEKRSEARTHLLECFRGVRRNKDEENVFDEHVKFKIHLNVAGKPDFQVFDISKQQTIYCPTAVDDDILQEVLRREALVDTMVRVRTIRIHHGLRCWTLHTQLHGVAVYPHPDAAHHFLSNDLFIISDDEV